jgi:hypothetical protein
MLILGSTISKLLLALDEVFCDGVSDELGHRFIFCFGHFLEAFDLAFVDV